MSRREEKAEKIRAAFKAGYTVKEIAKTFGLNESTVRIITHDIKREES